MTVAARLLVPVALACAVAGSIAPAASAQTAGGPAPGGGGGGAGAATDNRALAEMLFFTARGLMEAGRIPEACAKLSESYRLDPAAGTLLNLAVCHQKEGKIASAWGEFRQSIAEAKRSSRPDREKLASDGVAAVEPDLPFLTITVPEEVRKIPGLVIRRNGVPLNAAAWSTELPVDPGTVEIEEAAPDYKPRALTVTVANKQHATVAAEGLELAPLFRPPPPFWTTRREVGAALAVAGAAAAGVGAYFGVTAISDVNSSSGGCPTDRAGNTRCTQAGVNAANDAQTAAWASDISLGVGAVSALVGVYLFATGGAGGQEQPPSAATPPAARSWTWSVRGGPGAAGGALSTTF